MENIFLNHFFSNLLGQSEVFSATIVGFFYGLKVFFLSTSNINIFSERIQFSRSEIFLAGVKFISGYLNVVSWVCLCNIFMGSELFFTGEILEIWYG